MECKCNINVNNPNNRDFNFDMDVSIEQCPLCKTAPALLAACERACIQLGKMDGSNWYGRKRDVIFSLGIAIKLVTAETTQNKDAQDSSG